MFTINDFMERHRLKLSKKLDHWCAPKNGFDDITVVVTPEEFHDLCTQDQNIYSSHRAYGVLMLVVHNAG